MAASLPGQVRRGARTPRARCERLRTRAVSTRRGALRYLVSRHRGSRGLRLGSLADRVSGSGFDDERERSGARRRAPPSAQRRLRTHVRRVRPSDAPGARRGCRAGRVGPAARSRARPASLGGVGVDRPRLGFRRRDRRRDRRDQSRAGPIGRHRRSLGANLPARAARRDVRALRAVRLRAADAGRGPRDRRRERRALLRARAAALAGGAAAEARPARAGGGGLRRGARGRPKARCDDARAARCREPRAVVA